MSTQRESTSESGLVAALCPRCRTVATGDDFDAVRSTARTHDTHQHDGERVTRTVRPKRNHVEAFLARTERHHGRAAADEILRTLSNVAPWDAVAADREGFDGQ